MLPAMSRPSRPGASSPEAPEAPRAAHRAILDSASATSDPSATPPEGGWMARLEEARKAAPALPTAEAEPPPLPDTPPPLPEKPAHLLVAQLASAPSKPTPSSSPAALEEVSSAEIEVAPVEASAAPRRIWRDAVWIGLLVALVGAGLVAAYTSATEAPPPEVAVDPALAAKRARLAEARAALEEGHRLNMQGPQNAKAAIKAYRRALELAPDLASAERGLAIALTAQGARADAVQHYRRYLDLQPEADDADEIRAMLRKYEKAN